jgi:ankyrin repeat protein
MHFAAKADRAFALTFLYKNGANPDCTDKEGLTPLHWACYMASEEAIYFLLAWSKAIN